MIELKNCWIGIKQQLLTHSIIYNVITFLIIDQTTKHRYLNLVWMISLYNVYLFHIIKPPFNYDQWFTVIDTVTCSRQFPVNQDRQTCCIFLSFFACFLVVINNNGACGSISKKLLSTFNQDVMLSTYVDLTLTLSGVWVYWYATWRLVSSIHIINPWTTPLTATKSFCSGEMLAPLTKNVVGPNHPDDA